MVYVTYNKVRVHDTDMAGILYFARQFRFANEAMEDLMESEGLGFIKLLKEMKFLFVIVHCEANFFYPLTAGDELETRVFISKIGKASFTIAYKFYKQGHLLVGNAKTIHCTLDAATRTKIPIPEALRSIIDKHYHPNEPYHE